MEWTEVRYSRRRQGHRLQRDQGYGRAGRGMESARAFSGRGRPFSPYPNPNHDPLASA